MAGDPFRRDRRRLPTPPPTRRRTSPRSRSSNDADGDAEAASLVGDVVAGEALLWQIDTHNRSGHLGLALLPTHRGRGLGTDVVEVLCRFGFDLLGLHRLQIDTLSTNTAMRRIAERAGFVHEGTRDDAAWVDGQFVDDVIYGSVAPRRAFGERSR